MTNGTALIPSNGERDAMALSRFFDQQWVQATLLLLPAAGLLLTFLTYPLALGLWLAFTDSTIGSQANFVGLQNFRVLMNEPLFWLAVGNTIFYTGVATVFKFALGTWLAVLLNNELPMKSLVRALILIPWVVPTVLSAMVFWWLYDPQFSIISYVLVDMTGLRDSNINFLGTPWNARWSLIAANVWRGIPFVAITVLAGLQTISPSLYEAAKLDGASGFQQFRRITLPLLKPILSVVLTFTVIFTFTDFQLVYSITRGGPVNATEIMATLAFQRAIASGQLGEGAAIAFAMLPFLVASTLLSYFGLSRPRWQA